MFEYEITKQRTADIRHEVAAARRARRVERREAGRRERAGRDGAAGRAYARAA